MIFKPYHHLLIKEQYRILRRHLNSATCDNLTAKHPIYVSTSTNPYFNLTLEDWLFRNKDHEKPLLLLYRDEPSVVIGRNQNPWKEVNLQLAAERRVPFLRRRSGGGSVYHDLGNTNYSIHLPRTSFNRNETAKIVVRAVRSLGVDADVNERNDISAEGFKISYTPMTCLMHVSGSAYKIASKRAYHHGTMLISTKLDTLGDLLHTTKETMITKGVASVHSPVQNLQRFKPSITHEGFIEAAVRAFQETYSVDEEAQYIGDSESILDMPDIRQGMKELRTWDWLYGQTPEFTYTVSRLFDFGVAKAEITSKHGMILACKVDCRGLQPETLDVINKNMSDQRYGDIHKFEEVDWEEASGHGIFMHDDSLRIREIWDWMREETIS